MGNYKDYVYGNNKPNNNKNNRELSEKEKKIELMNEYIEWLSNDPKICLENQETFKRFDEVKEPYRTMMYDKMYQLYLKYYKAAFEQNNRNIAFTMQTLILRTINSHYEAQERNMPGNQRNRY